MESVDKNSATVKKLVYLWDVEQIEQLLDGVILAALEKKPVVVEKQCHITSDVSDFNDLHVCDKMFCTTCSVEFEERDDQKEHFRSDWHRFNLKRKLKKQETVTESKFEEITNSGDLSSISGTESSDDENQHSSADFQLENEVQDEADGHIEGIGKRHPRVFLRNNKGELFSVYRCVIHGKKNQADNPDALVTMLRELPKEMTWLIIMLAGGHFAAAVFKGSCLVAHKTFHRYVIRAKRGSLQSSHDDKGHAPKSAGASLRRYNEAALAKDVQDLLLSWEDHVKSCNRIFVRVPTYSKSMFYGGKTPVLDKRDCRIRQIPFSTRRPTLKEIHRVHGLLASVECYGRESSLEDHIKTCKKPDPVNMPRDEGVKKQPQSSADAVHVLTRPVPGADPEEAEVTFTVKLAEEVLDTTELQLYEVTRKPKEKNRAAIDNQPSGCNVMDSKTFMDPESVTLRNDLYTACKTKDTVKLGQLLNIISNRSSQQSQTLRKTVTVGDDTLILSQIDSLSVSSGDDNVSDDRLMMPNIITDETGDGIRHESQDSHSSHKSDSDFIDIVALLNSPFGGHGLTLLHVAAQSGERESVSLLLEFGADPSIKDGQGQLPYVAATKETRKEFRRFMAKYPEKYDYQKAQIPGPLSEEQEREKKAKEAERKKLLKKAKKERKKEERLKEARECEEEEERKRFLALSDREKRALAAERRLSAQALASGQSPPVLSRCFQCAMDITGKIPFQYSEYSFCSPKCLKQHRKDQTMKKS